MPGKSDKSTIPSETGPLVTCPGCGQTCVYSSGNRWRPFCSERCRMIDLGAWASDAYVVPGKVIETDDDAPVGVEPPRN